MIKFNQTKKLNAILVIIFFITINLFGQVENGLKLNIGLSKVKKIAHNKSDNDFQVKPGFSSQIGYYIYIPISERLRIGTELTINQIQSREIKESFSVNAITLERTDYTNKYIRNLFYLNLPIMVGIKLNKIQVNAGFQGGLKIHDTNKLKRYSGGRLEETKKSFENYDLNKFDFGPRVGLTYQVSKKTSLEAHYYHSLSDVLEDELLFEWRARQITIGVLYQLGAQTKR